MLWSLLSSQSQSMMPDGWIYRTTEAVLYPLRNALHRDNIQTESATMFRRFTRATCSSFESKMWLPLRCAYWPIYVSKQASTEQTVQYYTDMGLSATLRLKVIHN